MPKQATKPAKPTKRARRRKGESSVFFHEPSRLWSAIANLGVDENGKRKRRQVYGHRESEVLAKLAAIVFEVASGRTPKKPTRVTLGSFLTDWLAGPAWDLPNGKRLRPTTHFSYKGTADRHILGPRGIGNVRLRDLEPQMLTAFYSRLKAHGVGDRTRQIAHAILHKALGYALRQELVGRNAAALVDTPSYTKKEMNPLSLAQAQKFLNVAQADRLAALYTLAIFTGLREGELFGLAWGDLNLNRGTAQILHSLQDVNGVLSIAEVKTAQSRRQIHLPKMAVEALLTHRERTHAEGFTTAAEDRVFRAPKGGWLRYQYLHKFSFKPLLEKARLPNVRFHDLRHTYATMMLGLGTHPKIVQEALGHSKVGVTLDTYSHVSSTLAKSAAKQLDTAFAPKSKKARKSK